MSLAMAPGGAYSTTDDSSIRLKAAASTGPLR